MTNDWNNSDSFVLFLAALLTTLALLFAPASVYAQNYVFDVAAMDGPAELSAHVRYIRLPADQRVSLPDVLASEFLPLDNGEISFGYTSDQFWFVWDSVNSSAETRELVLDTNVKFMEPLIVYETDGGGQALEILDGGERQPFNARPLATPKLTLPLSWDAGERKRLLFFVRSGSGVDMTLELGSVEWVESKYASNRLFFALLIGILGTLILVNLFHFYAVRRWAHLLYAMQELAILLFMLHMDGLAFQYLWPDSPVWNAHATMVFGHLVNLMALLFAVSFLELKTRSVIFYRLLTGIAAVAFIMLLLTPLIEPQFSDQVGLATSGLGGLLLFVTGIYIAVAGYRPARYFVAGWLFMSIGSLLYGLANLALISLPLAPILFLRAGVFFEALLLSYGLSDQLKTLNETAQSTQEKLLQSTRKRLQEAQERIHLEQARYEAERELQAKDLDIARTRHDIRQPIYSLRLALLATKEGTIDSDTSEVVNRSLDHMEQLLLESGVGTRQPNSMEILQSYGDLTAQLKSEFDNEAIARHIEIRCVPSKLPIKVPLVPLKRVVSNLLANAIRHSGGSCLLVGLRRRAAEVEIMVLDNGSGMVDTISENKGEGLGMGIIQALCEEHGWSIAHSSVAGSGSCFRVRLPV
ncbi:MAG: sensor histidine kinase [Gammaproteobacteria bacterium]